MLMWKEAKEMERMKTKMKIGIKENGEEKGFIVGAKKRVLNLKWMKNV